MTLAMTSVPALRPGFRLQWEPIQNSHVLLYPEGMVKLNPSAGEIMALLDGERDVASVIALLTRRFPHVPDLADDVLAFIEVAHGQHWLQFH